MVCPNIRAGTTAGHFFGPGTKRTSAQAPTHISSPTPDMALVGQTCCMFGTGSNAGSKAGQRWNVLGRVNSDSGTSSISMTKAPKQIFAKTIHFSCTGGNNSKTFVQTTASHGNDVCHVGYRVGQCTATTVAGMNKIGMAKLARRCSSPSEELAGC